MRILTECPRCQRQFDVSDQPPGDRFHCLCGESLVIKKPEGHDSAVVRCSACGAPRESDEAQCGFCGAAFTLFETDRDTICPRCLTRVSRQARFCHSCGVQILPQSVMSHPLELKCPKCAVPSVLHQRQWAGRSLVECPQCGGLWIPKTDLERLLAEVRAHGSTRGSLPFDFAQAPRTTPHRVEKIRYYPCPACGRLMLRRRYPGTSVIVDICRSHGLWFDCDELANVLQTLSSRDSGESPSPFTCPGDSSAQRKPGKRPVRRPPRGLHPWDKGGWFSKYWGVTLIELIVRLLFR